MEEHKEGPIRSEECTRCVGKGRQGPDHEDLVDRVKNFGLYYRDNKKVFYGYK